MIRDVRTRRRAGVAHGALALAEVNAVDVRGARARHEAGPHPGRPQAQAELEIVPGVVREALVEAARALQQSALHRGVADVEEVFRHFRHVCAERHAEEPAALLQPHREGVAEFGG